MKVGSDLIPGLLTWELIQGSVPHSSPLNPLLCCRLKAPQFSLNNNAFQIAIHRETCLSADVMCSRSCHRTACKNCAGLHLWKALGSCFLVLHLWDVYVQNRPFVAQRWWHCPRVRGLSPTVASPLWKYSHWWYLNAFLTWTRCHPRGFTSRMRPRRLTWFTGKMRLQVKMFKGKEMASTKPSVSSEQC